MSHEHGFSIVIGRPLPEEMTAWAREVIASSDGKVSWHPPDALHATLVNATRPRARSVKSREAALAGAAQIREIALRVLPDLRDTREFSLRFRIPPSEKGPSTVNLPSEDSEEMGQLKQLLQGAAFYPADAVEEALRSGRALGVNKYSTHTGKLQKSAAITLGRTESEGFALSKRSPPPTLSVSSLRLVFYTDRMLEDALVSAPLLFGAPHEEIRERIEAFFREIDVSSRATG